MSAPVCKLSKRNLTGSRSMGILDKLPPSVREDFQALFHSSCYPAGKTIFIEQEPATSLYVVLRGEIRVSINSVEGKRFSLRIARKGDLLGLSSVLPGGTHFNTAEALYPSILAHIGREPLLAFLARHPSVYSLMIEELCGKMSHTCEQLRTVALSNSAPEKLARLLLDWSASDQEPQAGCQIRFALTHEQIGEFIGASRETVSRTMAQFKRQKLLRCEGSILTIPNRAALAVYTSG